MLVHYLILKTTLINLCLTILPPRKLFDLTLAFVTLSNCVSSASREMVRSS